MCRFKASVVGALNQLFLSKCQQQELDGMNNSRLTVARGVENDDDDGTPGKVSEYLPCFIFVILKILFVFFLILFRVR